MPWTAEIINVGFADNTEYVTVTVQFSDGDQVNFQKDYKFGRFYKPTKEELADKFSKELQAFKELREWKDSLTRKVGLKIEFGKAVVMDEEPVLPSEPSETPLDGM